MSNLHRLYDERLSQLSNEFVSLTSPHSSHPDYLAKLQCVDARRDRKIHLEQVLYQYKLKALQTKFMAMRSQAHSQYYQTARDAREQKLEEVGERLYKMQRDRRQWEGIVPGMFLFCSGCHLLSIVHGWISNRLLSLGR